MTETTTRAGEGAAAADDLETNPLQILAQFAAEVPTSSLPADVRHAAERGVVDLLGVMIAGSVQAEMGPLKVHVERTYAGGAATALGLSAGMTPEAAAYVNAAAGHVLDFDDCNDAIGGHPTVVVLPAALALAEETAASAADTIAAYVVGVEVACAIGRCLNLTHYERGWHPTATLGIFGATAASARMLGADTATTARALAIAASLASGIKGNFGTFMKPGQVGFATAKGVAAARLAVAGATANIDVFRGGHSFPAVFNGAPVDWAPLTDLGRVWSILSPGLVFKLYPCCGSTHAPIDCVLDLHARGDIDPSSVRRIDISIHPRRLPHTDRPYPRDGLQGKFSVQYATAVAAVRGAVTVADFADDRVVAPEMVELLANVHVHELPPEEQVVLPGRLDCFAAAVEVVDDQGSHRATVDAPKGSDPSRPVSDTDLDAKFVQAAGLALGADAAAAILKQLHAWCEGTGSLTDLMATVRDGLRR